MHPYSLHCNPELSAFHRSSTLCSRDFGLEKKGVVVASWIWKKQALLYIWYNLGRLVRKSPGLSSDQTPACDKANNSAYSVQYVVMGRRKLWLFLFWRYSKPYVECLNNKKCRIATHITSIAMLLLCCGITCIPSVQAVAFCIVGGWMYFATNLNFYECWLTEINGMGLQVLYGGLNTNRNRIQIAVFLVAKRKSQRLHFFLSPLGLFLSKTCKPCSSHLYKHVWNACDCCISVFLMLLNMSKIGTVKLILILKPQTYCLLL